MKKVESKKLLKSKKDKEFCIFKIDGTDYSCWDSDINDNLQEGDEINDDFQFTEKGQYKNLTGITKPGDSANTVPIEATETSLKEDRVSDFKERDADKYELGMAKNNAAVMCGSLFKGETTTDDLMSHYWVLVNRLYTEGKAVRKEQLGY